MAAHHDGISPHVGADLLRQTLFSSRSDDGTDDHIGSQSTTPSGVQTPRPDLSDKRLPSIMHAFLGQVGAGSINSPDNSVSSPAPRKETRERDLNERAAASQAPPTAPSTPGPSDGLDRARRRPASSGGPHAQMAGDAVSGYPTPPDSSASSLKGGESDGVAIGGKERSSGEPDAAAPHLTRNPPLSAMLSLGSRRHTAGLKSLSAIATTPVSATRVSNPTITSTRASTTPSTPTRSSSCTPFSSLSAFQELVKLTESVALSPRQKSTPPHTPRALSSSGPEGQRSPVPTSKILPGYYENRSPTPQPSTSSKSTTSSDGSPAIGPPKGKLLVKISEARGLKPSYDPYFVCVFEYNEYISNGPRLVDDMNGDGLRAKEDLFGGIPIKRSGSDIGGRSIAIPMKSRQSSTTSLNDHKTTKPGKQLTDPKWEHDATFDVVGENPDMDICVYDRSDQEAFLGLVRISPDVSKDNSKISGWFKLEPRVASETVSGEIHLELRFQKTDKKHYGPEDFQILKLIGKGTFGQVYQVRKKDTQRIYAMKVLSKKVIVQKKEVAHTLGERNILVRTAMEDSPFIVGLKFSFQTPTDLYLVTDFMSGGELFWHLQKEGRFNETRAKFYIAELILALEHLHKHDIVYRDLKPENILLDANGHIALCDFGLSKANLTKDATTNTFCGTTEYLAPEVLLDEAGYTTMVDFWSLGVLVFEMCCGWSPFYAEDTQQMYKNIAFGKVRFPRDALSTNGRNFVKGLLNRNPKHRLGANGDAEELKAHPFFSDVDWEILAKKKVIPPFKPKLKSVLDTSNFDPEFTNALANSSSLNARAVALANATNPASTPLSPGMQAKFKGFTFVDESQMDEHFRNNDNDRMEEEPKEDDEWENYNQRKREDRMSGIIKTTTNDEGIFNNAQFDD